MLSVRTSWSFAREFSRFGSCNCHACQVPTVRGPFQTVGHRPDPNVRSHLRTFSPLVNARSVARACHFRNGLFSVLAPPKATQLAKSLCVNGSRHRQNRERLTNTFDPAPCGGQTRDQSHSSRPARHSTADLRPTTKLRTPRGQETTSPSRSGRRRHIGGQRNHVLE